MIYTVDHLRSNPSLEVLFRLGEGKRPFVIVTTRSEVEALLDRKLFAVSAVAPHYLPGLKAFQQTLYHWPEGLSSKDPTCRAFTAQVRQVDDEKLLVYIARVLPYPVVWWALVKNPHCPGSALELISRASQALILLAVLDHKNCPPRVIDRLAKHKSRIVARTALQKTTNIKLMEEAASCKEWRLALASNPACPASLLETFLQEALEGRRAYLGYILAHPHCPDTWRAKLTLAWHRGGR